MASSELGSFSSLRLGYTIYIGQCNKSIGYIVYLLLNNVLHILSSLCRRLQFSDGENGSSCSIEIDVTMSIWLEWLNGSDEEILLVTVKPFDDGIYTIRTKFSFGGVQCRIWLIILRSFIPHSSYWHESVWSNAELLSRYSIIWASRRIRVLCCGFNRDSEDRFR